MSAPDVSAAAVASATYKKLTQLEHILLRADTYVGSKVPETVSTYIPDTAEPKDASSPPIPDEPIITGPDELEGTCPVPVPVQANDADTRMKMVLRDVTYVPAFFKIFDEILVNAADNKARDPNGCNTIKVDIDAENGMISVWNNGKGIPVQIHDKEGVYIPEMVFGHLLTGSNFDDNEKRVVGGRNGYGSKLTNIYSKNFAIETHDAASGKTYKQTWKENMSVCEKPKIKEKKGTDFTKVTFTPDFDRLNMTGIDPDAEAIMKKRVYDLTGSLRGMRIYLNGSRIKVASFKDYVGLYLETGMRISSSTDSSNLSAALDKSTIVYEKAGERWEVAVALSDTGAFQQVSFVNSISTTKGGTHVNHVADQIVAKLSEAVKKKEKNAVVKPAQIKNQIFLFVNCLIENPSFNSQCKEYMTLRPSEFGSTCQITDQFMKRVAKLGIVESTLSMVHEKMQTQLKKTDGVKRSRLTGLVKLDDANDAGSRKAKNCTLFLTEGLSAKTFAVTGIPALENGRDLYGAYPLRGKLLNVRDASIKQKLENQEITELKQILGLQEGKVYTSVDSLRYGRICCLVDSDVDGKHIKGLIINWLESSYPSLLKIPGFLVDFVSPIVKCTKGTEKKLFYNLRDYEDWKQTVGGSSSTWNIKYYKGLGTSKAADIKTYFTALDRHLNLFKPLTLADSERLDMVFAKKRAADRKEWLTGYDPKSVDFRSCSQDGTYSIADFIDKDLIEFSMYDNVRSIPSAIDGLKPGQRKILHTAISVRLAKDIKVAQFAGDVAKLTEYRHGEQSLCETIVGMAQDFVGSNNIALLSPEGQFGTRLQGGKDAASPRYIYTKLRPIARKIFHPDDDPLLEYIVEDGLAIEPSFYVPVLPMVLVNGCEGIGTGYSTTVLPHDPRQIAEILRARAGGRAVSDGSPLLPAYCGFTGDIIPYSPDSSEPVNKWTFTGKVAYCSGNTYEITELPVGTWTETYKAHLEKLIQDDIIRDYKEYHTDTTVRFVVKGSEKLTKILDAGSPAPGADPLTNVENENENEKSAALLAAFKLTTSKSEGNMMLFSSEGKLRKYATVQDILDEFYDVRIKLYAKRKESLLKDISARLVVAENKTRFVEEIISGSLAIAARKRADIEDDLASRNYQRTGSPDPSYSYLLNMSLTTLTAEKIADLKEKQASLREAAICIAKKTPESMYVDDLDEVIAAL